MVGGDRLNPLGLLKTLTTAAGWILAVVSATKSLAMPRLLNHRSQSQSPLLESYLWPSTMSTSIRFAISLDLNLQQLHLCPSYGAF